MDTRTLIDGIVQQTTVLIAQISTAAGIRAPLAHVADQVFIDLAREIEAQGVGRKVVADMFGLALRSYQKKVRRLSESGTVKGRTLWEAVLDYLEREGSVSRQRLFERFARDSREDVAAVLNDLVTSGLAYGTGRGESAVYGPTSVRDQQALLEENRAESLVHFVWMTVYRERSVTLEDIARIAGRPVHELERAVETLVRDGRIARSVDDAERVTLSASELQIAVGAEQGWESAVLDHFRAVASAIATKIRKATPRSLPQDVVGGATLSFDLHHGHPHTEAVHGLLHKMRAEVNALWNEVTDYNRAHPVDPSQQTRVYFYLGQTVEQSADGDPAGHSEQRT